MKLRLIDPEVTSVSTREGRLSLKTLFVPLFIEQLLMNLMGTVNTLVLGHYSDEAVAAVGAANQVISLVFTFYAVVSGGTSIVISHRLGAGKRKEASDAAFTSLCFAGVLSLVCSAALTAFAMPVMRMLNLEGEVLSMAERYFRIVIGFSFFQGIISAASAILRSYGKPRLAVGASVLMNAVNALLNYLVVFRPVEIPLRGAEGIGVSNVIAHLAAMIVILICLARARLGLEFGKKNLRTLLCLPSILKVGVPGGVSNLSYSLSQVVSTSILGVLGTLALSTKVYISSVVFYVYVVGMSLGLSTAILMGWMTGAKEYDKAYRLNQQVLKLAVSLNIVLSVLLFLFYRPVLGLFTRNPEILDMARIVLFIDIFVEIGRAFNHVEDNSLRGAGDVVFPMAVSIVSCWLMSILFSYILGIRLGLGLKGCWIAFMMDELFRGLIFWRRFKSRKWMEKKV
ncbi:MAG: MATE family efflux transporter [Eubacteriales bacterium]|nr:MATE family efflux transporter [Eubacteriales bacterium]